MRIYDPTHYYRIELMRARRRFSSLRPFNFPSSSLISFSIKLAFIQHTVGTSFIHWRPILITVVCGYNEFEHRKE